MRRFLLPHLPARGVVADLPSDIVHYGRDVLRLQPGTMIELFDGQGRATRAIWLGEQVEGGEPLPATSVAVPLRLACPLLKGERTDWLLEKLTELSVSEFVPLVCERAIIRELSDGKRARYERIVEAACRQSGRNDRMVIAPMQSLTQLPSGVFLDPRVAAPFDELCRQHFADENTPHLTVAIGPEGGFSDAETTAMSAAGWRAARLNQTILRAETAALMAASVAAMRWAG